MNVLIAPAATTAATKMMTGLLSAASTANLPGAGVVPRRRIAGLPSRVAVRVDVDGGSDVAIVQEVKRRAKEQHARREKGRRRRLDVEDDGSEDDEDDEGSCRARTLGLSEVPAGGGRTHQVLRGRVVVTLARDEPDLESLDLNFLGTLDVDADKVARGWVRGGPANMRVGTPAAIPIQRRLCREKTTIWSSRMYGATGLKAGEHTFPFALRVSRNCPSSVSTPFYSISYALTARLFTVGNIALTADTTTPLTPLTPVPVPLDAIPALPISHPSRPAALQHKHAITIHRATTPITLPRTLRGQSADKLLRYTLSHSPQIYHTTSGAATLPLTLTLHPGTITRARERVEKITSATAQLRQATHFRVTALREDGVTREVDRLGAMVVHRVKVGRGVSVDVLAAGRVATANLFEVDRSGRDCGTRSGLWGGVVRLFRGGRGSPLCSDTSSDAYPTPGHSPSSRSDDFLLSSSSSAATSTTPSPGAVRITLKVPLAPRDASARAEYLPSSRLREVRRSHCVLVRVKYRVARVGGNVGMQGYRREREMEISVPVVVVEGPRAAGGDAKDGRSPAP